MTELITRAQADTFFVVLLGVGFVAALSAGMLARRRGGDPLLGALFWGGPPLLIGLMWRVYNAITDRIGLDRVANLAVNFALFVAVGVACGLGWTAISARRGVSSPED
ncbi:MAG: hypothetical protein H7Z41_11655 [Cytophagales bacterium]|nr:hypothetical protein [Armatimonadota bacterium]